VHHVAHPDIATVRFQRAVIGFVINAVLRLTDTELNNALAILFMNA